METNPIDGMNNCGIKMVDNTLYDDLGFTKKRHLENFALWHLKSLEKNSM
jgi:hypothetical protein